MLKSETLFFVWNAFYLVYKSLFSKWAEKIKKVAIKQSVEFKVFTEGSTHACSIACVDQNMACTKTMEHTAQLLNEIGRNREILLVVF